MEADQITIYIYTYVQNEIQKEKCKAGLCIFTIKTKKKEKAYNHYCKKHEINTRSHYSGSF